MHPLPPQPMAAPAFPPAMERRYQDDLAAEKVRVARDTGLLCALLYLLFGILDYWAIPSALQGALTIRAIVVAITFAWIVFALRASDVFLRHYRLCTVVMYLFWAFGIEAIILISSPQDLAAAVYYAGLFLVSMALYAWTYLPPQIAAMVGLLITLVYVALAVFVQNMLVGSGPVVLTANCFFLVSSNLIGLFSAQTRERFSRQAFMLKATLSRDLHEKEEARREVERLAELDTLTELANRPGFMRQLDEMRLRAAERRERVALLFIDLDGFKSINDVDGHAAGDFMLQCVARRIRSHVRSDDVAARVGGDEFVIAVALSAMRQHTLEELMGALRSAICEPVDFRGKLLRVGVSIGDAVALSEAETIDELMARADARMYDVKRAGKQGRAALASSGA